MRLKINKKMFRQIVSMKKVSQNCSKKKVRLTGKVIKLSEIFYLGWQFLVASHSLFLITSFD